MNPRLAAAKALTAVLNGKASLNSSLPLQLDKVEARDRGLTQDLAFGTARWQPRLSALANKLLQNRSRPPMRTLRRCCWSVCTNCSTPVFLPTPPSAKP